jgi:imidazolonepropionase-like amidohydrolase
MAGDILHGRGHQMRRAFLLAMLVAVTGIADAQQSPRFPPDVQRFVTVDEPLVALTHVRVLDGTGSAPRADQTIVIRDGRIAAVGNAAAIPVPAEARTIDLPGRTVVPGFVMVHEHMYYPAGDGVYNELAYSFPRLYLAGGATTVRTGGNVGGYADLELKRRIDAGLLPGPHIDATAPYLEGPGLPLVQVHVLEGADDARRMVEYWAAVGATSFKAYMHITRAELGAAIEAAHRRGLKLTGHLCSVTFREAAELGIDDLEHGLLVATDFVQDKKPDECPPGDKVTASIAALDVGGQDAQALIRDLVARKVAITSTLTVFETFVPDRPPASDAALDAMAPDVRDQYLRRRARIAVDRSTPWATLFQKEMQFERAFAAAGGLLIAGTDPTGYGGVVAGFSNQRAIELLVEAGFTPAEAIRIVSLNGATYLGRADRTGTIAVGKDADLAVIDGDPSTKIEDIERVEMVFKSGVGYDPAKLIAATRGVVGLR